MFLDMFLDDLARQIRKEKISSCLIYHKDKTLFGYFKNRKVSNKLFQLNSVTKSIISILIGVAIDRGIIDGVQTPISDYFANLDVEKQGITVEHLLTMTPGLAWGEFGEWGGLPFPMIYSKAWVKFILEKEMQTSPGVAMAYSSGCSHLLSAILQKATRGKTASFAEEVLFKPLGITDYRWPEDAKGISIGGFGLCLNPVDMLKIGVMMMQNGLWQENQANLQVVSREWIADSTKARYHTYDAIGSYGYHWWVLVDAETHQPYTQPIYFAMGYGGQYIIVSPDRQLVVVYTSDSFKDTLLPLRHFRKHILNAFEAEISQ